MQLHLRHYLFLCISLVWGSLPSLTQAQFIYQTNNGTITITGYNGPGGDIEIPGVITGLPVTRIGEYAFGARGLRSVTIPDSVITIMRLAFDSCSGLVTVTFGTNVTDIGERAFFRCAMLNNVTLPNSLQGIRDYAFFESGISSIHIPKNVSFIGFRTFAGCPNLTSITVDTDNASFGSEDGVLFDKDLRMLLQFPEGRTGSYAAPDSVTDIVGQAFYFCSGVTNVIIPSSVLSIGPAFLTCTNLLGLYCEGNAPTIDQSGLSGDFLTTVYYLPGTTGWGPTYGGRPTALWRPQIDVLDASFATQTNQFGFKIEWGRNTTVVVEASTNLATQVWSPLSTNNLINRSSYFGDPAWTNYPARLYRIRSL